MMKRFPFRSILSCAALAAVATTFACGGISDPTAPGEPVATVTGALSGTSVPIGTRVALVWRGGTLGTWSVTNDVAVIGGRFSMDLTAPSAESLFEVEMEAGSSEDEPGSVAPPPADDSGTSSLGLAPRDVVSGGIAGPLKVAVAGFVVYVDTNGNGKLDIAGETVTSSDQIVGGNDELTLAYFQGGGALDYERLRDRSGIAPTGGYNLQWAGGERWVPLDNVDLKLASDTQLPSGVCALPADSGPPDIATPSAYPSPDDPHLHCSADGLSYTVDVPSDCGTPEAPATHGLCSPGAFESTPCAGASSESGALPLGDPVPEGWPCPVDENPVGGGAP